jgi:hypothetical protein
VARYQGKKLASIARSRRPSSWHLSDAPRPLTQLEAALKSARPIQFKENIALVLKYFDQLASIMQEQDSKLRPAD